MSEALLSGIGDANDSTSSSPFTVYYFKCYNTDVTASTSIDTDFKSFLIISIIPYYVNTAIFSIIHRTNESSTLHSNLFDFSSGSIWLGISSVYGSSSLSKATSSIKITYSNGTINTYGSSGLPCMIYIHGLLLKYVPDSI